MTTAITVHAHKFSETAQQKIIAAGGKAEIHRSQAACRHQARQEVRSPEPACSEQAGWARSLLVGTSRGPNSIGTEALLPCSRSWRTSSKFRTCAGAFCLRLGCLPSTALAATCRRPALILRPWHGLFANAGGGLLGFVDLFSGGNLRRLTIFALGIMPYITASIILQLLTVVYEPLARLQKEGELGRKKITQWTRYLTVLLSAMQSFGIAMTLQRGIGGEQLVRNPGIGFVLMTMLTLTTGTTFIMWLGEQITERGIGNGMSLIIFTGIVVGLPRAVVELYQKATQRRRAGTRSASCFLLAVMVVVVAFIVFVERSERRIPVQYAKRVVGRKVMGGQSTHLPLRVNSGGVMPVIFASSVLTLPQTVGYALQNNRYFGAFLRD